ERREKRDLTHGDDHGTRRRSRRSLTRSQPLVAKPRDTSQDPRLLPRLRRRPRADQAATVARFGLRARRAGVPFGPAAAALACGFAPILGLGFLFWLAFPPMRAGGAPSGRSGRRISFSTAASLARSSSAQSVIAEPEAPLRAVRPIR